MTETINHPPHYGGGDNPYECIKVIEAWGLGFCAGNAVKYILRAGKKGNAREDLEKALWYLTRVSNNNEPQILRMRSAVPPHRVAGAHEVMGGLYLVLIEIHNSEYAQAADYLRTVLVELP